MNFSGYVPANKFLRYGGILISATALILLLTAGLIYLNRNKINRAVEEAINSYIQGEFSFNGVSFVPFYKGIGVTFVFRDVEVLDHVYAKPVMKVKRLGIRVSPSALWNDQQLKVTAIIFEKGSLVMVRNKDGYSTMKTFGAVNNTKQHNKNIAVIYPGIHSKIIFDDLRVAFIDSARNKSFDGILKNVKAEIQYRDRELSCFLDGLIFYNGLVFNDEKGAFLKGTLTRTILDFSFLFDEKKLVINDGQIVLNQEYPVSVKGAIQLKDTLKTRDGVYQLEFETNDIPAAIALSQLPEKIEKKISRFGILPLVDSRILIRGEFNNPNPLVEVRFVTDTFQFAFKDVILNRLKATGYYSSQYNKNIPSSDANSILSCTRIDGFFEQFPLRGSLKIMNFTSPEALINYDLKASIYNINSMVDPDSYRLNEGDVRLIGKYHGDLKPLYDVNKKAFNGRVSGTLTVRNLTGEYLKKNVKIRNLNADVRFDEESVSVHRMSFFQDEENKPLQLKGRAEGLLASLLGGEEPVRAEMDIRINEWRLKWLEELNKKENKALSIVKEDSSSYKLSAWIDRCIGKLELQADLVAQKVAYQKFVAEDVKGQLLMYQDNLELNYFSLKAFHGEVTLNGGLTGLYSSDNPRFSLQGTVRNADVKNVFYSLGNFGQTTLTDKNIEGLLQAEFSLLSELNEDASLVSPSLKGELSFELSDGKIKNFEPFLNIKKLVFKNRNLEDVQFEPIRSTVTFRGKEIFVDRLQVNSNVLAFSIGGIYSFGNATNLSIRIPISNFHQNNRRKKSEKAIYLKAIDQNGSVNIMLDGKKSMR